RVRSTRPRRSRSVRSACRRGRTADGTGPGATSPPRKRSRSSPGKRPIRAAGRRGRRRAPSAPKPAAASTPLARLRRGNGSESLSEARALRRERERDDERRPAAGRRTRLRRPAVRLGDGGDDREAETDAAARARPRAVDPVETLEHLRGLLLGQARTGVADAELDAAVD